MSYIDTDAVVSRLRMIESLAVLTSVDSTNAIARRVIDECIENEIPLPSGLIIAREQTAGRGRAARSWQSPFGAGIYATLLFSRPVSAAKLLPLEVAIVVADFLRETFQLEARIKWPNDLLVNRRKIAGILIEARTRDEILFAAIGIGINITGIGPVVPEATSVVQERGETSASVGDATVAFIEFLDARLFPPPENSTVIDRWRKASVHEIGDPISSVIGERRINGTWEGIDDSGRALIRTTAGLTTIAAGDVVIEMPEPAIEP